MDLINSLIDNYNIPVLSAFLLGVLTSISPCPLATNITAIAFVSKDVKTPKHTVISGFFYTLGRSISYTLLAIIIYFGLSSFKVSGIFQGCGNKIFGPAMIIIGLTMFGAIRINVKSGKGNMERVKVWSSKQGYFGSLLLGMLFAFAFCPYSGALFFGAVIPLIANSNSGILLSPVFGLGTGLPVIIFAFLLAYGTNKISKAFSSMQKIEKVVRILMAVIFVGVGLYYSRYLI